MDDGAAEKILKNFEKLNSDQDLPYKLHSSEHCSESPLLLPRKFYTPHYQRVSELDPFWFSFQAEMVAVQAFPLLLCLKSITRMPIR